jgi:hypothetical protein
MIIVHILAILAGAAIVASVLSAALRTVVVPRGERVLLSMIVFGMVRRVFGIFAAEAHTYERRDRVMSRFAPTALMLLPVVWAFGLIIGFTPIYWGLGVESWRDAFLLSGSSLTTLGFRSAPGTDEMLVAIVEAVLGLGLVALLISFLPTIYAHFSRRETIVAKLYIMSSQNGVAEPATALVRSHQIGGLGQLDEIWKEWDRWFVELSESHRSFPSLTFFRSPEPDRSWVNGAGIALDLGALYLAVVNVGTNPRAALMIHSGYLSLRSICDFFGIPYDADPMPDDPISITREEFEEVYERLAVAGVPVRPDRNAAWRAYAGWRVNYDRALINLAAFTMAPYQAWVSDRALSFEQKSWRDRRRT